MNRESFVVIVMVVISITSLAGAEKRDVVYQKPPPGVENEFRFLGNALVCISKKPGSGLGYEPCLHIGAIHLDADMSDIETTLGEPAQVLERSADTETRVYALPGPGPKLPYFAIDVQNGRAVAIQLTGQTPTDYSFSGVALGDREKIVTQMLGPPSYTKEVDEVKAVLWSYNPFPISIELKNSRVYSIRIYKSKVGA